MNLADAMRSAAERHHSGKFPDAETLYRHIIAEYPQYPDVKNLLGFLLTQTDRAAIGLPLIEDAISLDSTRPMFHNSHGLALFALNRIPEAVAAYRRALELQPDFPEALNNLGNALSASEQFDQAIEALRHCVQLQPNLYQAHFNLAKSLLHARRLDEAIESYQRTISLNPNFTDAYFPLARALHAVERLDEALAAYQHSFSLRPDAAVRVNIGSILQDMGRAADAVDEYRAAVEMDPRDTVALSNVIFGQLVVPGCTQADHLRTARQWSDRHAAPLAKNIKVHDNDRSPERRLRIGYVSADFRDHASAYFLLPLLRHHDPRQVEITCYAEVPRQDAVTEQMRALVAPWRTTTGRTDVEVAGLVRQDQIDILVDLKLHTGNNRLLVFAQKPAPVQATWLGYPGTTGIKTIDYRLTDPYLDPPGTSDEFYSEQSIRLPDTFWCYDPLTDQPPVNKLPVLHSGHITFGCLNSFSKVTDYTLDLWARVLAAVPGSRFLLLAPLGQCRQRVLDAFLRHHVQPTRIDFVIRQSRENYLALYHRIDIALDTFPYNGHTTSLDCQWMGVPIVTMVGSTAVARGGLSQLSNLNLADLAASNETDFVRVASTLASDLSRLTLLRSSLRQRMLQSPLMDAPRFVRNVEAAYRQMWRTFCQPSIPSPMP